MGQSWERAGESPPRSHAEHLSYACVGRPNAVLNRRLGMEFGKSARAVNLRLRKITDSRRARHRRPGSGFGVRRPDRFGESAYPGRVDDDSEVRRSRGRRENALEAASRLKGRPDAARAAALPSRRLFGFDGRTDGAPASPAVSAGQRDSDTARHRDTHPVRGAVKQVARGARRERRGRQAIRLPCAPVSASVTAAAPPADVTPRAGSRRSASPSPPQYGRPRQ
jgi:hypothetical protein